MKEDLNYLLFEKEVYHNNTNEKKPFFRFQNDLAEAIVESPGYYSDKEVKNMRPYLNQVLKSGGVAYEKPMSENLKEEIIKILRQRLSPTDPLYNKLDETFNHAYELLKKKDKNKSVFKNNDDYEELIEWSSKANKFIALLHEPGEIFWSIKGKPKNDIDYIMNRLFRIILKNFQENELTILDKIRNDKNINIIENELKEKFTYSIYLPNYNTTITFWQKLFEFFYYEKLDFKDNNPEKTKTVSDFFKIINGSSSINKQGFIRVFKIDPHLTAIPLFFCQSNKGIQYNEEPISNEEIFFMNLNKGIVEQVVKLSPNSREAWKENVYFSLMNIDEQNKLNISEIRFVDYEQDILSLVNCSI